MDSWGYASNNGPRTWHTIAPAANGRRQSPIDICAKEAEFDASLIRRELWTTYVPANAHTLINLGHSIQIRIDGRGSVLEGGPLHHKYQVVQFHFHWGHHGHAGSEHRVNGHAYDAELHIVHCNKEYATIEDAMHSADGLCVLAVFLQVGQDNANLTPIIDLLSQIPYKDDETSIPGGFDPSSLLPEDRSRYWTYPGSLTTPPCSECVTWIVFKDPIDISEDQLARFHQLLSTSGADMQHQAHLTDNYRPIQPLHDRTVRASFRKFFT